MTKFRFSKSFFLRNKDISVCACIEFKLFKQCQNLPTGHCVTVMQAV